MDAKKDQKDPSELAQALQVISSISRSLPSPTQPENNGYVSYGPPNRVDEGVRLRDDYYCRDAGPQARHLHVRDRCTG